MKCRFCGHDLSHVFVDLGNSPPSNSFLNPDQLNQPEIYFPLKLFVCDKCFLVQIDEFKRHDEIFSKEYVYFSSFSRTWLDHAKKYTDMIVERLGLHHSSQVVEVASNDGYLLQYFEEKKIPCLGIEPAKSTAEAAREKGIEVIDDFFGVSLAKKLVAKGRSADLLIGNNVLAHVPDISDFVKGMKILLKKNGVITLEFPHLMKLVENNQFDTIYHEHFSYFSFSTVKEVFTSFGLKLFDVEELSTHGGSLRVYASHTEAEAYAPSENVFELVEKESSAGIKNLSYYQGFQTRVDHVKDELLSFLIEQKKQDKNVAAYGAAAKGNTLLNYCGIKKNLIQFVADASPHKQGKLLPGSHIPIVSEKEIFKLKPDWVLILPWNIQEEIVEQLGYIRDWNGKFAVSIPRLASI